MKIENLLFAALIILTILLSPTVSFASDQEDTGAGGGAQAPAGIGTIKPPPGYNLPDIGGDPTAFVAGIIKGGLWLLIIVAFIIGIVWMIFAGYRFIFAGGDEKAVSSAWSSIYWGLLGLVIVVGAFAIIKMVEVFFNISIIGNFQLPQR